MTDVKLIIIKDHGDGEFNIQLDIDFTIYEPTTSLEEIKTRFEKLMLEYAI